MLTDGHLSGLVCKGLVVAEVSPEGSVCGPLALVADGDTVTIVKDLKVKGSSQPIKVGTKVRGIRLVQGVGDHDIDCKVDGFGPMQLKSSVVKKA